MKRIVAADGGNAWHVPDSEWSTIVNALLTAAASYDESAVIFEHANNFHLKEQFTEQAAEARALADKIAEEAGV